MIRDRIYSHAHLFPRSREEDVVSIETSATRKWALRSVMKPLSAGASQSESLSLLHRRLCLAEGQGAELAKRLGVSGDEPRAEFMDILQSKALGARMCRLESLLHALKLSVFRIETTRDLTSSHTAHLQEQLTALQEQFEEEQRSSQREAMRLRDQLQQEREEAQRETQTLREQLHVSYRSQMDVRVAADELRKVKGQLSRKLYQMKEELAQETAARLEAEQSHDALLQKLMEMEGEVKLLQTESHALNVDRQEARAELEEKAELIERLQEECQNLRQQLEEKDIFTSDLSTELKIVKITLQKQQKENSTVIRGREELRAATDKVQALNDQLEAQCSDLSSALRSLTEEKAQLQASLKALNDQLEAQCSDLSSALRSLTEEKAQLQASLKTEQERTAQLLKDVDLQLDTAKRNMQCEVQQALADRSKLNKEFETLKADHIKLQQSSAAALDAAVNHQELLERTIKRLREELSNVMKEGETTEKEREEVCAELEYERKNNKSLQEQLKQVQEELQVKERQMCVLVSETEYVQRENLRLKDQQHNTHMRNTETLQTELGEILDVMNTLGSQREVELHRAKQEINQLTRQVNELRRAKHRGRKSSQREVCELMKALDEASSRSRDLSQTNRELRDKVRELENLVCDQNTRIKAQTDQLKQRNKNELDNSAWERSHSLEQLRIDVASLQAELFDLSSSQQKEVQAERHLTHTLQEKCEMLEDCVVKLKEDRVEVEQKMKQVSLESQQISENLQEAHSWFRSKFNSLESRLGHSRAPLQEETRHFGNCEGNEASPAQDTSEVVCVAEPELERWATTLQRWEMKKELDRTATGYKAAARTHLLT